MNNVLVKAKVAYTQSINMKFDSLKLLKGIASNLSGNKKTIIKANEKDIIENNGFKINFDIIDSIIKEIREE